MRRFLILIVIVVGAYLAFGEHRLPSFDASPTTVPATGSLGNAADHTEVAGVGTVSKILPDDNEGSRHQRFILRLSSGQTVLVAHNIDLAPRVAPLVVGDAIEFKGEYAWNDKGGTVHWTHRDPAGRHEAGWLKHAGNTFQ